MTEDRSPKDPDESAVATSVGRQRKKRKWDQPAEPLLSAGIAVPGVPLAPNTILGTTLPGAVPFSGSLLTNSVPSTFVYPPQLVQSLAVPQNAAAIIQKLNQPKIQDELIAREIVINDAEPTARYKLTKRQTQEEIQKCTGAVVITRGKYRPPNGLPDCEKPLYLHISAGAHLKDTAERIKAVDHAAAMVEEILKQGQSSQMSSTPLQSVLLNGPVIQALSMCLFLGFDADPSLNIATRIRGPNVCKFLAQNLIVNTLWCLHFDHVTFGTSTTYDFVGLSILLICLTACLLHFIAFLPCSIDVLFYSLYWSFSFHLSLFQILLIFLSSP